MGEINIKQNGRGNSVTISGDGNSVVQSGGKVYINGEEIKNPPHSPFGQSVVQTGDKVFVNGYKFDPKTKTFKFSLWSWLEYILS
ncbi:hypothetical protein VPHD81_0006 [Vibrio phage D81]